MEAGGENFYMIPCLNDSDYHIKLINNLMIEAGSGIMNSLLQERLIDELVLYKAPKLLGENRLSFINLDVVTKKLGTIDLEIDDIEEIGEDIKYSLLPRY